MKNVTVLTIVQGRELYGKKFAKDSYFNPVLDKDMNIIISETEVEMADKIAFPFLAEVELKPHDEIFKNFETKEEWLEYYKLKTEEELQKIALELEMVKNPIEINPK